MKKKTLAFILTLCMTVTGVICFAAGAAAAGGLQEIKAFLNADITLKLDGEAQVLKDANGVRTYPITYNDTTYLPVRSIAGLLGVDVGWDQATQSVLLGKQPSGIDLIDTYKAYYFSRDVGQIQSVEKKTEDISGVSYDHWIWVYFNGPTDRSVSFNIQGKHDTLTFSYYADCDTTLTVLGDNDTVLGEFSITGAKVAQTVTIPLFKTNELKFHMVRTGNGNNLRIFDAYLDAEQ
ncbi:hypothetical protein N510_000501 [Firmicutes bacterium ASF500]|nr:hypothetical protein N510_000501 [Firmicutes bacterium ASF500]